jgi:ERCC4-related helicase
VQVQCIDRAIQENTIINMPTGMGKTLVACCVIDHFVTFGTVLFLVPTRVLVPQQAIYCKANCSEKGLLVHELEGAKAKSLKLEEWKDVVRNNDVLVGTAEVFRRCAQLSRSTTKFEWVGGGREGGGGIRACSRATC